MTVPPDGAGTSQILPEEARMADITIRHTMDDGTLLSGSKSGATGCGSSSGRAGSPTAVRSASSSWVPRPPPRHLEDPPRPGGVGSRRPHRHRRARAGPARPRGPRRGRTERFDDRQLALADRGRSAHRTRAGQLYPRQQMGDAIPFGQPVMPDHYSYHATATSASGSARPSTARSRNWTPVTEATRAAQASEDHQAYRPVRPRHQPSPGQAGR